MTLQYSRATAEAMNLLNDTGMTPRQIADQRDELLEALQELLKDMVVAQGNMMSAAKRDSSWEGCAETIQPRIDAARAAIAKATGQAHG